MSLKLHRVCPNEFVCTNFIKTLIGTLENTYETLVRSKLEYNYIIWYDCSKQDDSNSIETCQLRAARIVTGAKKGTSHDRLLR